MAYFISWECQDVAGWCAAAVCCEGEEKSVHGIHARRGVAYWRVIETVDVQAGARERDGSDVSAQSGRGCVNSALCCSCCPSSHVLGFATPACIAVSHIPDKHAGQMQEVKLDGCDYW
jgi:hypothetical protein